MYLLHCLESLPQQGLARCWGAQLYRISVFCRATYAAEQSVQKLEKGKQEQDLLIDHLHQQVRTQEQQIAIYTQQYEAQRRESRAAKEMLAGAEAEMEGIHFEKKQLTAQWQSSLIATQRRDQALRVSLLHKECVTKCQEKESMTTE